MPVPNPVFLLVPYRLSTGINSGSIFSQLPINGTGDFTYTRPGSASFVGSNGNIQFATSHAARILNYYSGSGTCPAFLIEPSAENLCQQSENFSASFYNRFNLNSFGGGSVINTTATLDPYGTNVADYIQEDSTTSAIHAFAAIFAGNVSGTTYTWSVFAKAAERTIINLLNNAGGGGSANFNLTTGVATLTTGVAASMQNYGNGWWRCRLTYTSTVTGNHNVRINLCDALGNSTYNGTGNQGAYVFGTQLEIGSVATSYIPTTTAAVTRNPDNSTDTSYTLPLPNGTMYTEHFASRTSSYYAHSVGPIPITTGSNRIAVSYTPSKIAVYKNGSFLMSQSIGTYEVGGSIINLGHSSGSYQLNDNLLAFAVYDSELTPADAISLTSGSL